jgi:hypothetical protein
MLFGLAFLGLPFLGLGKARMRRRIATTDGRVWHQDKGHQAMPRRRPTGQRSFPGRLTLEQRLARPLPARIGPIRRAQCERSQAEQPRQPQRDLGEIGHQHQH